MSCEQWKHDWVAHLYGELEPGERRHVEEHLAECGECRETMDSLAASREILRQSAPAVPASPGVVVLQPRSAWRMAWAFAAGAACAAAVFVLGLYASPMILGTPDGPASLEAAESARIAGGTSDPAAPATDPQAELLQALFTDIRAFEERLDKVETRPGKDPTGSDRFQQELDLMERRYEQERARDLEYVMEALTASEIRTGTWIGQTQEALDLLALRQDPRFRER